MDRPRLSQPAQLWLGCAAIIGATAAAFVASVDSRGAASRAGAKPGVRAGKDKGPWSDALTTVAALFEQPSTPADAHRANLLELLRAFASTPIEPRRAEIVDSVRERLDDFEDHLLWVLEDDLHELVVPGITVAGALPLPSADLPLTELVRSESTVVRSAAIRARAAIRPWSARDIGDFLQDPDVDVLLAALGTLVATPVLSLPELLPLLAHDDHRVGTAAVAAMRPEPTAKELAHLCAYSKTATGAAALLAAEALGRFADEPAAEAALVALLTRDDWTVRSESLRALGARKAPLTTIGPLLQRVADTTASVPERLFALLALERTGTTPRRELLAMAPDLHPVLRLAAARCLCAVGEPIAVGMLIDLLTTEESDTVDHEDMLCARGGAHQVLCELADEDLGTEPDVWKRWQRRMTTLPPRRLSTAMETNW